MSEKNIDCAIAHFDKKVTDYQLHVDRELINQDKKINTQEKYLINTLDSHKKLITDFIEENANAGTDAPTNAKFTKVFEQEYVGAFSEELGGTEHPIAEIENLNLTKCIIMVDFTGNGGFPSGSWNIYINDKCFYIYDDGNTPEMQIYSGNIMFDCDVEDGILRLKSFVVANQDHPGAMVGNVTDHTGFNGEIHIIDKISNIRIFPECFVFKVTIYGR